MGQILIGTKEFKKNVSETDLSIFCFVIQFSCPIGDKLLRKPSDVARKC